MCVYWREGTVCYERVACERNAGGGNIDMANCARDIGKTVEPKVRRESQRGHTRE